MRKHCKGYGHSTRNVVRVRVRVRVRVIYKMNGTLRHP